MLFAALIPQVDAEELRRVRSRPSPDMPVTPPSKWPDSTMQQRTRFSYTEIRHICKAFGFPPALSVNVGGVQAA